MPSPILCRTLWMMAFHPRSGEWRPTSIGSTDSIELPVRCHWEYADDEARCSLVLAAVADAWEAQVDRIGWPEPLPDGDALLDVYITDDETEGGAYAYGPGVDEVDGDGLSGCHAYIALDPGYTNDELRLTVAHEFSHVLQYGIDFNEPSLVLWEGTATAAQGWTFPDDYVDGDGVDTESIADFQATPWVGLLGDGTMLWDDFELWSYYEYGSVLWITFLDRTWGNGDGSGALELWMLSAQEGLRTNEPDVLDALDALTGDGPGTIVRFDEERLILGTDHPPAWLLLSDADLQVEIADEVDISALPTTVTPEYPPFQTGVTYIRVTGAAQQELQIGTQSDAETTWATFQDAIGGDRIVGVVDLGGASFDGDSAVGAQAVTIALSLAEKDGKVVDDEDVGCGCASGASGAGPWWLGVLPVLIVRRRGRDRTRGVGRSPSDWVPNDLEGGVQCGEVVTD